MEYNILQESNRSKQIHSRQPIRWRQFITRILLGMALLYLGALAMLSFLENRMIFHPSSASEFWQEPDVAHKEDIFLALESGTNIHAWWCPFEGAKHTVIIAHGNGGNLSHRAPTIRLWHNRVKASVLMFDYPGYGNSEGRPTEQGCYAAGDAAYQYLVEEQKIPPETILLFGRSLGGGVATYLASQQKHKALILSSTFTTLPDIAQQLYPFFPVRWLMRNRFDSLSRLKNCRRPIFIVHGDADTLIRISHAEKLYEAASEPKQIVRLPGQGHNHVLPEEVYDQIAHFLKDQGQ